ncbi:MAG: ribonuclease III [Clostridia bacterium]|nr:ribonuclease III [Clostridia bacterium]
MSKQRAYGLPALQLAFIGDTVCDLLARTELMFSDLSVRDMHRSATSVVNARAQADQLAKIRHLLDADETDIVHRARNAHPGHTVPQAASREEYMAATGFEALMGYLYLTGQMLRAQKLFQLSKIKE